MGVLYCRRCPTQNCAFLANIGQVVVARHVIPLSILVGDGHHTVLPACEKVIWLTLPPILIDQIVTVSPLKVILHCTIIESNPGVVMTQTINKVLLSGGDDAAQVCTVLSAVFLCILPGVSVGEVPIAVTVKLLPAMLAAFDVFLTCVSSVAW